MGCHVAQCTISFGRVPAPPSPSPPTPAGPLFGFSMFRPESKWGEMGRSITNDARPEANMLGAASDKEVVGLLESFPPLSEGLAAGPAPIDGLWGEHQLLRAANVSVVMRPLTGPGAVRLLDGGQSQHSHPKDHAQLHKFYELGHPVFSALWAQFVRDHAVVVGQEMRWTASSMERGDDGSYSFSIKALSVMHHRFAAWGALPARSRERPHACRPCVHGPSSLEC